jgi:hypothetical protein
MKYRTAFAFALLTLSSFGASADTPQERTACMGDAFRVCGHAIPNRDRVIACLYDNPTKLSNACRAVIAKKPRPATAAAKTPATEVQ